MQLKGALAVSPASQSLQPKGEDALQELSTPGGA